MLVSLKDAQQQYTTFLVSAGKANATVIAYTKDVEQLVEFIQKKGKFEIAAVSTEDIREFKSLLKKQRYTDKSISRKINSIKSFFRYLISQNIITENVAVSVTHPKIVEKPPGVLSKVEYRALRDACKGDIRIAAIVEVLLQTGMRISELANLKVQDIDLERNVIHITPNNSLAGRKIPLNKAAKDALLKYLQVRPRAREKTIFLTKTCRPFLVRNIRTTIDRYFRLAGIRHAKINDLRNTFIVEQLRNGTPLVYVSQLVGHKRITTTEKYIQLIDGAGKMSPTIKIEEL